jgi:hypothetical protein
MAWRWPKLGALALLAAMVTLSASAESWRVPPSTRALLDAASPEPVEVTLQAGRVFQGPGEQPNWLPGDHRIAFRIPAAAVDLMDLARGRMGPQRLGLELWSETLDPVRPDRAADRATCRPAESPPCAGLGPGSGRIGARVRADEYALRVEVTNAVGTEEHRRRVLRSRAGVAPAGPHHQRRPCDVREGPAFGMLVARAPEGMATLSACEFFSSGAVLRGGTFVAPASFLKLEPDGTPKFSVRCSVYVTAEHAAPPRLCELQGYLGIWPLFLWVRSDRAAEWDATFERVRAFLARHTVSRTD